jgi:hypothetical protein
MPDQDNIDDRQLEERLRRAFRWMADDSGRAVSLPAGPQGVAGSRDDSTSDGETPLYLDDPAPLSLRRRTGRTAVLATAAVVILAAVGVSLGIVATGSGGHGSGAGGSSRTADSAAKAQVVSALSATTSAGNWDISYSYGEVAGSVPTTTVPTPTMLPCSPPQVGCAELPVVRPDPQNVTVTGTGVIDVNPKAMVTDANVSNFGRVVLRIDATQVWELLSVDSGGLAPDPGETTGAGQSLSSYAGLVEGTLGTREGAVAMLGIASPTGYLELDEQAITGVTPAGTGMVDGQSVTEYHVSVQPAELASDPSASPEQAAAIQAAVATLDAAGLSGTSVQIAVDAQGFIIQSITTYNFTDGGSVTVQGDFSNFGCAGTISMPGQSGPTAPPTGCVSPDSPSTSTPSPSTSAATSPPTTTATSTVPNPATSTTPTVATTVPPPIAGTPIPTTRTSSSSTPSGSIPPTTTRP